MNTLKTLMAILIFTLAVAAAPVAAHGRSGYVPPPSNYVNVSFTVWHPAGFGLQHQVRTNVFLTGQLEYLKRDDDLLLQAGAGPDMFIAPNDSLGDDVRAGLIADITADDFHPINESSANQLTLWHPVTHQADNVCIEF